MDDSELPECLGENPEAGGFVDLDLRLVRLDVRPDGTILAEGRGRHDGHVLGFALGLDAEWKTTPIGKSDSFFYWGTGTLRSLGEESDALLATLTELYGVNEPNRPMRLETSFAVVGLAEDPRQMATRPARMKLFFESEEPACYAEVYVNVIATEQRIEFHEKDPDYRRPLLLALGDVAR